MEALGGTRLIHKIYDDLTAYMTSESVVIETGDHDVDQTYKTLMAGLQV